MSECPETIVYVCMTCRPDGFKGSDAARPGAIFGRRLGRRVAQRGLGATVRVQGVECLGVCKRPCTVAVSGAGKFTYVIGDLDVAADTDVVLDFALLYGKADDGITVWRERPRKVRKNTVARVPPFAHERAPVLDVETGER